MHGHAPGGSTAGVSTSRAAGSSRDESYRVGGGWETAPLIFTALVNHFWHESLLSPISAVTLNIVQYAISPYDQWHQQAWAASFFLLAFVLILNVAARLLSGRAVGR